MKLLFFYAAIIFAFIATFITLGDTTTTTDGRGWWFRINYFAGAFLCFLLSQAPFVGS
jgi:hypothetical protein